MEVVFFRLTDCTYNIKKFKQHVKTNFDKWKTLRTTNWKNYFDQRYNNDIGRGGGVTL